MHQKSFTIIIPTFKRTELLGKCLFSINDARNELDQQVLDRYNFKIVVVLNGEKQKPSLNKEISIPVNYIEIAKSTPAKARNIAIQANPSDFFYFLDDDVTLPTLFFKKVIHIIETYPELEVFGGPDAPPLDANWYQKALGLALRSPLTTLKTRKRHRPKQKHQFVIGTEKNLILCNLAVRGDLFSKYQISFNENFFRNEENILLQSLDGRAKIGYFQDLYLYHHRNPSLRSVFKAASLSAYFRMQMIRNNFQIWDLVFMAPMIFMGFILIAITKKPTSFWYIPIYIYWILNFLAALRFCFSPRRILILPLVMFYQFYVILSYGIGATKGVLFPTAQ